MVLRSSGSVHDLVYLRRFLGGRGSPGLGATEVSAGVGTSLARVARKREDCRSQASRGEEDSDRVDTGRIALRRDTRGSSLVEVMVAMALLLIAVFALASSGSVSTQSLRSGRSYMAASAVAQTTLDSLTAVGWDSLDGKSGSGTVEGYPFKWSSTGTNPRHVVLVVSRDRSGRIASDTFVTYVAR